MLRSLRLTALALLLGITPAHAAFDYEVGGTPPYSGTQLITDINEELTGIEGIITDAETACFAALTSAADKVPYFTGLGTCALADLTSAGRALIDDADASAQRTTLGLVIGANVQAYDADLTTYAGITPSANVQSLLGAADYAAMRALLDLEAGTDFYSIAAADAAFQPLDADLTAIAGLTSAADKVPYFTGSGTAAVADFSAAIRTLITTPSSANLRSMLSDETGTGAAMFGLTTSMADDLSCTGSQVVRRNAGDTAFECATVSVSDTLGPDGDKGDITVGGTGTTLTIDAAAVSADELDEAGVEAGLEAVLDLADLQGDLALGTKTSGNYVDDVTAGTGIAITHTPGEGSDAAVALSYSDQGASPSLSADQCVFTSNATTSGFIVCEGDTADAFETRVTVTDPTADRLFTIPNADSVAVQPNTCSGTDKVTGVSAAGVVSCAADEGGAGSGDNIGVEDGDNAGTFTSASDANFEDSGDINFVLDTGPSPDEISATIRADAVALTTDTTGNYVGSVADGTGIDGTAAGEGATYTPTLDLTELNTFTLGAGAATGIVFDAGATDPAIEVASGSFTIDIGGTNETVLDASNFTPGVNDGNALGSASLAWADVFLATGGLIEFDGGTTNSLTCTGGNCTIEGNGLYRAGGTDVAIPDGGTGAGDAATAFSNLKQAATTSATGVAETATDAECETGTDTSRYCTPSGVLAAVTGKKPIWIPGGSLIPRTTNGCTVADLELATNDIMTRTCNFNGAGTSEIGGGFWVKMPASWDEGTVSVVFTWAHPSTTTNFTVKWQAACLAVGNDDAMDAALGTGQAVEDTGGTTTDLYVSAETSAITCAGTPAAGDAVYFEFERHPGAANDTMTVDAYLVGVTVYYTDNAFVEP